MAAGTGEACLVGPAHIHATTRLNVMFMVSHGQICSKASGRACCDLLLCVFLVVDTPSASRDVAQGSSIPHRPRRAVPLLNLLMVLVQLGILVVKQMPIRCPHSSKIGQIRFLTGYCSTTRRFVQYAQAT